MFVDASVIVAILNKEPGFEELVKALAAGGSFHISPLVRFEAVAALARIGLIATNWKGDRTEIIAEARALVDGFIEALGAKQIAIDQQMGSRALDAMQTYGKLSGHAAQLNCGDCFAYAAASACRLPLLYKGDDFAKTDL